MIETYRKTARTAGAIFLILNLVALLLAGQYMGLWFKLDPMGRMFGLAIVISAFTWYYNFAKSKGYSGWFSLLGFLHLIGFVIILLLPNKTTR